MLKRLMKFLGIKTMPKKEIITKPADVVESNILIKNLVKNNPNTRDKLKLGTRTIYHCHCGRRTLIKNHEKLIDKNGETGYSCHIICPNCGNEVTAVAYKYTDAMNIAITKWNRSNKINSVLVERGYKVVKESKRGRPCKA